MDTFRQALFILVFYLRLFLHNGTSLIVAFRYYHFVSKPICSFCFIKKIVKLKSDTIFNSRSWYMHRKTGLQPVLFQAQLYLRDTLQTSDVGPDLAL